MTPTAFPNLGSAKHAARSVVLHDGGKAWVFRPDGHTDEYWRTGMGVVRHRRHQEWFRRIDPADAPCVIYFAPVETCAEVDSAAIP